MGAVKGQTQFHPIRTVATPRRKGEREGGREKKRITVLYFIFNALYTPNMHFCPCGNERMEFSTETFLEIDDERIVSDNPARDITF